MPAFVVLKTVIYRAIQNPKSYNPAKSDKIQNLALGLLLIFYLAVALAHAALAPLTTGPDEMAHYEYMNFIAQHGRLPLTTEERSQASYKSDQPPLYHLIAALPVSLVDPDGPPYLKRYQDHLRRDLISRQRHAWGLYNTEDERWPYRAEVLRWQMGRWVAILFGAATIWVTFRLARDEIFSGNAWLALTAAAAVAFIPRFALSGSMLNYETTLAFFAALFLWTFLRIANSQQQNEDNLSSNKSSNTLAHPSRLTPHVLPFTFYVFLLGLFAGLAIVTKLSALILPLEIGIGLALIARHYGWGWRTWARQASIAGLATLMVVGCWISFILYQFNTVATEGWWVGLLRPLVAADSSDATTNRLLNLISGGQAGFTGSLDSLETGPAWVWLKIFFQTFWVADIEKELPLGGLGLVVALGLTSLAIAGFLGAWLMGKNHRLGVGEGQIAALAPSQRLILSLLLWHVGLAMVLPLIRYLATFSLADTAQGRHLLFQAAPALAVLGVWGLLLTGRHWRRNLQASAGDLAHFTVPALPLFLLVWSLSQLQTMTWAYPSPLPVWTRPEVKGQISQPLEQPLNEAVTLLGYDSQLDPTNRILRLDLWWQATALSPVDYLTQVKLLDAQGLVQAQWLGYSANGRYPTRAWDVGDIVRDTTWLPTGGLEAGQYSLELQLLPVTVNPAGGELPSLDPAALPLSLGPVTLNESTLRIFDRTLPFASDIARAASGYSVWHQGQAFISPQIFGYRESILVTLQPLFPDQERVARLVGPPLSPGEYQHAFAPVLASGTSALFIVGADWPSGDYQLQVTLAAPSQPEQQVKTASLLQIENRWDRNFGEPVIPHRLEANFANQVKLLGYELGANRTEPGEGVPVTLYWQGLDWMGENYIIFTKLLAADQTVHGGRDRLPLEGYSTLYWAPGEIITDPFGVPVETDAPEGIYYLNLGLYKLANGQAQSLPLVQDGQLLEMTSLNLGPIKVGQSPPGFTLSQAEPQHSLNQPWGEAPNLTLLGYDLLDDQAQPLSDSSLSLEGVQNLNLKLYWRSEASLPLDYTVFVHIRDEAGETVAQQDQPPLQGAYPTSLWDPGEVIADELVIPLPPGLEGRYEIVVGLYDFKTGARLPVPGWPDNAVSLGRWGLKS
jgi:hypothetical protein